MLIDVAISGDRNVIKKETESILKYKDLTTEIQRMWNIKTKAIPVIIRKSKTYQNNSENTRAKYSESTKLRNFRKRPY
jgi:hypothetical protein